MKEKIIEIHCAEEFDKMFLHLDSKLMTDLSMTVQQKLFIGMIKHMGMMDI